MARKKYEVNLWNTFWAFDSFDDFYKQARDRIRESVIPETWRQLLEKEIVDEAMKEVRLKCLECSSKLYEGRGEVPINQNPVIALAREFEKYILGQED